MVKLDESNIPIQWFCPPCDRQENPHKYQNSTDINSKTPISKTVTKTTASNKTATPKPVTTTNNTPTRQPAAQAKQIAAKLAANNKTAVAQANQQKGKMPVSNSNLSNTRLVFPDVKVRDLPFFPVKAMLLRPCLLNPKDAKQELQQQNLAFYLSPDQANVVNSGRKVESNGMVVYKMHILLRFTKKSADGVHDDDFPKNLCLKVNNKVCPLPNPKPVPANRPNMEAKRPPKPLIITSLCKLNTKSCLNQMSISWTAVPDTVHAVSVYLVEKLVPVDLLNQLKSRGQRDPMITDALIRSKLEDKEQDEIATTSCKVSMACPLGMARMTYPARSSTCDHLQCFDGDTYLRMNEKKPKWLCPVCNKPAYFEHLFLDGFYIQLLQSQKFRTCGTNDIVLNQDASWEAVITDNVGVSDDSDDDDPLFVQKPAANSGPNVSGLGSDVITILPESDPVSQLAKLPIAPAALVPKTIVHGANIGGSIISGGGVTTNSSTTTTVNDDFLSESALTSEDNFTDWNYSIKFFTFIRGVPDKDTAITSHEAVPAGATKPLIVVPQQINTKDSSRAHSPPLIQTNAKSLTTQVPAQPAKKPAAKPRGRGAASSRGGRGAGRSAASKRAANDNDDYESGNASSADSEERAPRKKPRGGGGRGRGRGRGRGAGARGGGAKAKPASKRPKYNESSVEESSESETEVMSRPVVTKSGRPSRNCRQSTNYAEIEGASDVLDYLLEHR